MFTEEHPHSQHVTPEIRGKFSTTTTNKGVTDVFRNMSTGPKTRTMQHKDIRTLSSERASNKRSIFKGQRSMQRDKGCVSSPRRRCPGGAGEAQRCSLGPGRGRGAQAHTASQGDRGLSLRNHSSHVTIAHTRRLHETSQPFFCPDQLSTATNVSDQGSPLSTQLPAE